MQSDFTVSPEDRQFLKLPLNASVGRRIASKHKRDDRFGCLVRVARVEGRRRVVLDSELNSLRDLWSSKFGHDAKSEVNSGTDAAGGEDIAVAHNASFFVTCADQGQQVDEGPMSCGPTALNSSPAAPRRNAPVQTEVTYSARAPWRRMKSIVSTSAKASTTPDPPGRQMSSSCGQLSKVRNESEAAVARNRQHGLLIRACRGYMDFMIGVKRR